MSQEGSPDSEGEAEELVQRVRGFLSSAPEDLWSAEAERFAADGRDGYRRYASGSPARTDADASGERAINLILTRSQDALMAAADHMAALERALAEAPMRLQVSPWSIARTALEAESRAAWILEGGTAGNDKISRALLLSLKDTEYGIGSKHQEFAERIGGYRKVYEAIAGELGLRVKYEKRHGVDRVEVVGPQRRPSIGSLVGRMTERNFGESYYGLLSEISHSSSLAKDFSVVGVMPSIIFNTIYCFCDLTWKYFKYCGLDLEQLGIILDSVWTQADFPGSMRFWQQANPSPD